MRWFLAAALLFAGCAASPSRPPASPTCGGGACNEQDAEDAYGMLRRLEAEFHTLDAQPPQPDCIKVNTLTANVCALKNLICQIADQQPPASTTHERCRDSQARCKNAYERAEARGCGKK